MLPQDRRAAVLSYDATLDTLAAKLYQATDAERRAALSRDVTATRDTLTRVVDAYVIAAGDLRR